MLKKEYFFKSQESLATVIDNDEDDDDDQEDQDQGSEDKVETPPPETDAEQQQQQKPDDNKCKQTANTTASKSNQFHENFRENDFTKKNQDDPNAATTANAPQHPSDGDDVDTASNNVDTIQTASKKTTPV